MRRHLKARAIRVWRCGAARRCALMRLASMSTRCPRPMPKCVGSSRALEGQKKTLKSTSCMYRDAEFIWTQLGLTAAGLVEAPSMSTGELTLAMRRGVRRVLAVQLGLLLVPRRPPTWRLTSRRGTRTQCLDSGYGPGVG